MTVKSAASNSELKKAAAIQAADLIQSGMMVGIGTGSTIAFLVEELGRRMRMGLRIQGVPTSYQSKLLCVHHDIPVLDPSLVDGLDLAIDGADEIDRDLNAIKGGGAAQTLEKIIAAMAREYVLVADESKLVDRLCRQFPLPVEVLPQGLALVKRRIQAVGGEPVLRMAVKKDGPVITENGNFIVDISFGAPPSDLSSLDIQLKQIPGLVETGLFLGYAQKALVAKAGQVIRITPGSRG